MTLPPTVTAVAEESNAYGCGPAHHPRPAHNRYQGLLNVVGRAGRVACRGAIHCVHAGLDAIHVTPTPPRPDYAEKLISNRYLGPLTPADRPVYSGLRDSRAIT